MKKCIPDTLLFEPPPLGCALYLPGLPGGSSKIYDRSPYGNIGTKTGATWTKLPSGLWVLSFDGIDDYVRIEDADNLDNALVGAFTLLAWLNPGVQPTNNSLIDKRAYPALGPSWKLPPSHLPTFWKGGTSVSSATTALTQEVWQQAAVTWDDVSTFSWYRNGLVDRIHTPVTMDISANVGALFLGAEDGSAYFYSGQMSLIRIFNRVLSALEIADIFSWERWIFGV